MKLASSTIILKPIITLKAAGCGQFIAVERSSQNPNQPGQAAAVETVCHVTSLALTERDGRLLAASLAPRANFFHRLSSAGQTHRQLKVICFLEPVRKLGRELRLGILALAEAEMSEHPRGGL